MKSNSLIVCHICYLNGHWNKLKFCQKCNKYFCKKCFKNKHNCV